MGNKCELFEILNCVFFIFNFIMNIYFPSIIKKLVLSLVKLKEFTYCMHREMITVGFLYPSEGNIL